MSEGSDARLAPSAAQPSRPRGRPPGWRLGVPLVCAFAGLLAMTSMINAKGTDLRAGRHTDLIGLVSEQRGDVQDLRRTVRSLQSQVDALAERVHGGQARRLNRQLDRMSGPAGLEKVNGAGLLVTLDDAPLDEPEAEDVNPNLLVVHQQDIQAVVNALWSGGAQAVSLQRQRIINTTGIKCVGNTVVLQGVPYSPPYRIAAVGDPATLYDAVMASDGVQAYLQYTQPPYNLGWSLHQAASLVVPPYDGPLTLDYAKPATVP